MNEFKINPYFNLIVQHRYQRQSNYIGKKKCKKIQKGKRCKMSQEDKNFIILE